MIENPNKVKPIKIYGIMTEETESFKDMLQRRCTFKVQASLIASYMSAANNLVGYMAASFDITKMPDTIQRSIMSICTNSVSLLHEDDTPFEPCDDIDTFCFKKQDKQMLIKGLGIISDHLSNNGIETQFKVKETFEEETNNE